MPQFDFYSFFFQTFWVLILFLLFYFFVLYNYLSNTAFSLKFRKKLIATNLYSSGFEQDSNTDIYNKTVKILFNGVR